MPEQANILEGDDFTLYAANAVDLIKGRPAEERPIGGYCSTEHFDRQEETVLQKGLDFEEFVNYGWYNDNHNQATAAGVGYPELAQYKIGRGWYTEGHLLKGFKRADEIWEMAKALVGTPRRLGFSIEGKVIERRANYVVKAKIRNVAITKEPVNTHCTWNILAKSFDPEFVAEMQFEDERDLGKALKESAEQDEVVHLFACPRCERSFKSGSGLDDHLDKSHSGVAIRRVPRVFKSVDEVAAEIIRLRPTYSKSTAQRIAKHVLSR